MNRDVIIVVLFIFSLYFLVPIAKPEISVTAIPETPTDEIYRFQSPSLRFSSEINDLILINVTYLDLLTNDSIPIHSNIRFVGEITLDIPKSGFYQITVFSSSLGIVKVKEIGINPIGLTIFSFTLFLNVILIYRRIQEFML